MAENSAISWTDHTFNGWWGCTKVGPGCDHCYAETFDKRVGGSHWGSGAPRRLIRDWTGPRKWQRQAEKTGVRPWVFASSMCDVFDNEVPTEWRDRLWDLVRETPLLRWQFVTKRIGNAAKMLPPDWPEAFSHCGLVSTIVNQAEAERDIPKLLATPAAWRGLSMEPLLGPVDISPWLGPVSIHCDHGHIVESQPIGRVSYRQDPSRTFVTPLCPECGADAKAGAALGLDSICAGGESGPGARPMHPDWARSLRDQCAAAGVPFHFKQWGEWLPTEEPASETQEDEELRGVGMMIGEQYMRRVGKARSGRLLDGVEHNGMHAAARPPHAPVPMGEGE